MVEKINPFGHENKSKDSNSLVNATNDITSFQPSVYSHALCNGKDKEIEILKLQLEIEKLKQSSIKSISSDTKLESNSLIEDNKNSFVNDRGKKWGLFKRKIPIIPKEKDSYEIGVILKENTNKSINVKKCPICNQKTYRSKVFMEDNKSCQIVKCKNKYCVYVEKITW